MADHQVRNTALKRALLAAGLIILASFGLHEALEGTISRRAEPYVHHHLHTLWGAVSSVLVAVVLIVPLARGLRMPLERPFPSPIPSAKVHGLELENRWLIQTRWVMSILAIIGVAFAKGLKDCLPSTPWIALAVAASCVPLGNLLFVAGARRFGTSRILLRFQIVFDLLLLAVFFHLTGATKSPVRFLAILHMLFAAILLSRREAFAIALLTPVLLVGVALAERGGLLPHRAIVGVSGSVITMIGMMAMLPIITYYTTAIMANLRRREAQMALAGKMAAVGELTGAIAHEINNPVAIVSAKLEALQRSANGSLPETVRGELNKILGQVRRIGEITHGMLAYARPSHGMKEPTNLNVVVGDTLELVRGRLRDRGIGVETTLASELPEVLGNFNELSQVALNLINNAVDAMAQGGWLRIRTLAVGRDVALEVQDTGLGMMPEIRAKLFEPFFTTKSKEGGTGLGLAICQGLVQSHEGHIEVESEPGKGSIFRVVIPALQAVAP